MKLKKCQELLNELIENTPMGSVVNELRWSLEVIKVEESYQVFLNYQGIKEGSIFPYTTKDYNTLESKLLFEVKTLEKVLSRSTQIIPVLNFVEEKSKEYGYSEGEMSKCEI